MPLQFKLFVGVIFGTTFSVLYNKVWRAYFPLEQVETSLVCDQGTLWNPETSKCVSVQNQQSPVVALISYFSDVYNEIIRPEEQAVVPYCNDGFVLNTETNICDEIETPIDVVAKWLLEKHQTFVLPFTGDDHVSNFNALVALACAVFVGVSFMILPLFSGLAKLAYRVTGHEDEETSNTDENDNENEPLGEHYQKMAQEFLDGSVNSIGAGDAPEL
ncbi:unnamed protein product [Oikopleura dioica]|uniref:Uncharacterized protein n=1 Tax=Oikopleura dioica TaxID=34765 RepID=E4XDD0_OIKDI|nr:unnamed protein product [Oikopleura dioica]